MSDRITLLRLRLGLSQPQFAARVGIHRNSVLRYESGQTIPQPATLRKIARVAGLTIEQLLAEKDARFGQKAAWSEARRLLRQVWREPRRRALVLRTLRALV